MNEIAEIDKEVRRLRKRIFELNARRLKIKKLMECARQNGPTSPEVLAFPVKSLRFCTRLQNMFKNENVETLGDLVKLHKADLRHLPNFGAKSLVELEDVLLTFGLRLNGDE